MRFSQGTETTILVTEPRQVWHGLKDAWQERQTQVHRCLFRRVLDPGVVSSLVVLEVHG